VQIVDGVKKDYRRRSTVGYFVCHDIDSATTSDADLLLEKRNIRSNTRSWYKDEGTYLAGQRAKIDAYDGHYVLL